MDKRTFLTSALAGAVCAVAAPSAFAKMLEPKPAPDFTLPLRGGGSTQLSKLKGQVVMINWWASWCGPCRQEFPILDDIYRKNRPRGFNLLAINVEPDMKDAEEKFLKNIAPVSFPILLDKDNAVSKLYGVNAMPSTVLVDRQGRLRWLHRGYKPGDENQYLDATRTLLREK